MKISYNACGKERKRLAQTIGTWLGEDVKYAGAPTFAYHIGEFTLDKDGNLTADGTLDPKREKLLDCIDEAGFISETAGTLEKAPSIDSIKDEDSVTLSFPDTGFTDAAFERLKALAAAKASLITKALDTISTEVIWDKHEGTIAFPWFKLGLFESEDEKLAAILFLNKLMDFAKEAKRVTAKEKESENEKYAFRCFLLRLGFIGDDFKGARKVLLSRLSGNSAFKSKEAV
ncbi:MAG: virulence protein [Oscillospiraceae bacterium]|nr:virulence protein [Oscillospiraceae bacterium]